MTQPVTSEEFKEKVLENSKPVLVDFFATWCGPCKMMAPVIDEIAAEMAGKVDVYTLDIDESMDVAREFGIMSVPTFVAFKDGQPVARVIGAQPKDAILALF